MADSGSQRQGNGISLTGAPVYDQDLYGNGQDRFAGYEQSIGPADEEDERTQTVGRCLPLCLHAAPQSAAPSGREQRAPAAVLLSATERRCLVAATVRERRACSRTSPGLTVLGTAGACSLHGTP